MAEFVYQNPFPVKEDTTKYRLITKDFVSTEEFNGRKILKVKPEGLELLARVVPRTCDNWPPSSKTPRLAITNVLLHTQ